MVTPRNFTVASLVLGALCLALVAAGCGAARPEQPAPSAGARPPYGPPLTATDYAATMAAYPPPVARPTREGSYPWPHGERTPIVYPTRRPEPPVVHCADNPASIPRAQAPRDGEGARLTFLTSLTPYGRRDLWSIAPDGTDARLITDLHADAFAWAPDGGRLAFTQDITTWLSDAAGEHTCPLVGLEALEGASGYRELAWSPAHDLLAVTEYQRHGGGLHVQIFDAGDGSQWDFNGTLGLFATMYTWSPAWSPDGSQLAYIGNDSGKSSQLSVSDLKSPAGVRTLVDWPGEYRGLTWSPDGSRIAFSYAPGYGPADIYVVNADGTDARQLTDDPFDERGPAWSPDGRLIAFVGSTLAGGYGDAYTIDADGAGMRRLTKDEQVWAVAWRP